MSRKFALTLLAGIAFGAAVVQGLQAQQAKPAYYIVDVTEVTNADGYKAVLQSSEQTGARVKKYGGHYVVRSNSLTASDGTPPQRMVIIAFENMEKAKAFVAEAGQKEIDSIRLKNTKSRAFFAEGL